MSLERGTSDLLGGLKRSVSRALFRPEIESESNILPRVSLVAILATVRQENSG